MPTTRPRHLITETDEVAEALDDAARRWPEDAASRARLLVRLVKMGHNALLNDRARRRETRLAAVRRTSGALTGSYPANYLEELRQDWPE